MTSYHDLEDQVYKRVRAKPFTRIYGPPDWQKKELLRTQAQDSEMEEAVSYDWSRGMGLLVIIMGTARYGAENPTLPALVEPVPPASSLQAMLGANATAPQIQAATDANTLARWNHAMLKSFKRACNKNIMDALDLKYYQGLRHSLYKYIKILPI